MTDSSSNRTVVVATPTELPGLVAVPAAPGGVVVFAHGSDSSRLSPRNQAVAAELNRAGFITLLFDLLTPDEARDRRNVFDIELLAGRLEAATAWLPDELGAGLPLGLFGASTGAAAALVAAARLGDQLAAVVSRGGRPDLAGLHLPAVTSPTLLIVGSRDEQVLDLNRQAMAQMECPAELAIVKGATHLFSEPGALEEVSRLACDWFARFAPTGQPDPLFGN